MMTQKVVLIWKLSSFFIFTDSKVKYNIMK